jgi:SAM-dependent methyltransferase
MLKLKEEKPWFMEWFDENYRMLYRHRNRDDAGEQVCLIIDTLKPNKNTAILDLGCGEGRYTAIFKKKGYRVFGLDLSETLVTGGKKKEPCLDLMVGDMRFIPGSFDLILSLFTSFGYFDTDAENEAALSAVYQSLDPGGYYWLDFLNSRYVKKNLVPETHSRLPSGIEVLEKRKIVKGRVVKDIHFKDNGVDKHYRESVRLFSLEGLEAMFHRVGFRICRCFGDYRGSPCSPDTERAIIVGRKEP